MVLPSSFLKLTGFDPTFQAVPVTEHQNFQLSIDKIGLRCKLTDLDIENAREFYSFKPINIMIWGDCVQINVHPEWYSSCPHLGMRCLYAIEFLMANNVFKTDFVKSYKKRTQFIGEYTNRIANNVPFILGKQFKLMEWEIALDFYDHPILKTANEADFHWVGWSNKTCYSNDFKDLKRLNALGIEESNGKVHSFIKFYNRNIVTNTSRPCYRLEFRYQGVRAKKDLHWGLLKGDTYEAFYNLLDSIVLAMRQITKPENLIFDQLWLQFSPPPFATLIFRADWLNMEQNNVIKPRRPKGFTSTWSEKSNLCSSDFNDKI